mmetsp:Transcript_8668/g.26335  ORF Transcript_8668/g.26335 Transcript_8668/m.26335 type:complete len:313 (-) Transcript_8668:160-1098(-)
MQLCRVHADPERDEAGMERLIVQPADQELSPLLGRAVWPPGRWPLAAVDQRLGRRRRRHCYCLRQGVQQRVHLGCLLLGEEWPLPHVHGRSRVPQRSAQAGAPGRRGGAGPRRGVRRPGRPARAGLPRAAVAAADPGRPRLPREGGGRAGLPHDGGRRQPCGAEEPRRRSGMRTPQTLAGLDVKAAQTCCGLGAGSPGAVGRPRCGLQRRLDHCTGRPAERQDFKGLAELREKLPGFPARWMHTKVPCFPLFRSPTSLGSVTLASRATARLSCSVCGPLVSLRQPGAHGHFLGAAPAESRNHARHAASHGSD